MNARFFATPMRLRHGAVLLVLLPALGWTQSTGAEAAQAWRQANDLVGQFHRGHADLLRWEQSQSATAAPPSTPETALDLTSAETAVERAWNARPALSNTLNRLGNTHRYLLAAGRWSELPLTLRQRLDGLDDALDLAMEVRKAWLQATASQLALGPLKTALDAAQTAQALGQRMVAVGNWSQLAQAPQRLAWANAQLNWQRAQYSTAQDRAHLLKLLELPGQYDTVRLPDTLPELPQQAMTQEAFASQLQRVQVTLPRTRQARHRAAAQLAYQAYLASHAIAAIHQQEIVPTQALITDETQLHYSGMLKSTWELLGAVQNQAQARADLIQAQRDFAIASLDLEWALSGGEPNSLVTLGASAPDATPKGH